MCEGTRLDGKQPESVVAKEFLVNAGVKESDIITDEESIDTVGNAYFLRTMESAKQDVLFRSRSMVVITNEFHMNRTKAIFEKVFGNGEKVKGLGPFPWGNSEYTLEFEHVNNRGIQQSALQKRIDWEEEQLREFERVSEDWKDLRCMHQYMLSEDAEANA
jgi:uncharacterized SAM-binding protein YcdF (DUF218 family)